MEINADVVRELLEYSPETGEFKWKARDAKWFKGTVGRTPEHARNHWNARHVGRTPGATDSWGHTQIKLFGKLYAAHRLAWLYVTGEWPVATIDHIDCNPSNNAFANLREATHRQNGANKKVGKANRSGVRGVHWVKDRLKWGAAIRVNYQRIHLGFFDNIEDAAEAYAKASKQYHGEFGRVSRKE
jgi:hypothetical protein